MSTFLSTVNIFYPAVISKTDEATQLPILCQDRSSIDTRVVILSIPIILGLVAVGASSLSFGWYAICTVGWLVPLRGRNPLIFSLFEHIQNFERKRSNALIDDHAVDHFIKQQFIPTASLEHIAHSPLAMAKLLQQPGVDLNKTDTKGKNLFDQFFNFSFYSNKDDKLASFKLLVDKFIEEKQLTFDLVKKILRSPFSEGQIYILKKNIFQDLTEKQQLECFQELYSSAFSKHNIPLLIEQGFNLNTKNEQGNTLLIEAIIAGDKRKILDLLTWGAELPENYDLVNNKGTETNFGTFLANLPSEMKIFVDRSFHQTQAFRKQNKPTQLIPPFKVSSWNILKPAIKDSEKYENGLLDRIMTVTLTLFISLSVLFIGTPVPFLGICAMAPYALYERSRAMKALNKLAIDAFSQQFPNQETMKYIVSTESAFNQILEDKLNLTKIDNTNQTLLDHLLMRPFDEKATFPLFTKLVDALDRQINQQEKYAYVLRIVSHSNIKYLEYIFQKGWVDFQVMPENEQFHLLSKVGNPNMINFLQSNGCNLEVKDHQGQTFLLALLYGNKVDSFIYIRQLIASGADLKTSCTINQEERSVTNYLNSKDANPVIQKLLNH